MKTALASRVGLDEEGRLLGEVSCLRCGYNLRGAEAEGACPECGLEVERSLRGDRLMFADAGWLATVSFGWVGLAWVLSLGSVVTVVLGVVAADAEQPWIGLFAISGWLLGTVICVWCATERDPRDAELESRPAVSRPFTRWAVVGYAGLGLVSFGASVLNPTAGSIVMAWGPLGVLLLMFVAVFSGLAYMRHLGRRVPLPSIGKETKILTWGLAVSISLFIAMSFGAFFMTSVFTTAAGGQGSQPSPASGQSVATSMTFVWSILGVFSLIGLLVFGVWSIVLTFLFGYRLRRIARRVRSGSEVVLDSCTP